MEATGLGGKLVAAAYGAPVTVEVDEGKRDLIAYGFATWVLTLEERCACCGEWRETASDALGGIEPFLDERSAADLVAQLLAEVGVR